MSCTSYDQEGKFHQAAESRLSVLHVVKYQDASLYVSVLKDGDVIIHLPSP